jgi:hypothetical protein
MGSILLQTIYLECLFLFFFLMVCNVQIKRNYEAFSRLLLVISILALVLSLVDFFINKNDISLFNYIVVGISVFTMCFSLVSFFRNKNIENILITLKSDEYDIKTEMHRTTNGGATQISKIVFKDGVIDSFVTPYDKVDATFICLKKGEKEYSCRGYVDESEGYTYKKLLNKISKGLIVLCTLLISIIVAFKNTYGFSDDQKYLNDILKSLILIVGATFDLKLFRNNKDIVAILMKIAGCLGYLIAIRRIFLVAVDTLFF